MWQGPDRVEDLEYAGLTTSWGGLVCWGPAQRNVRQKTLDFTDSYGEMSWWHPSWWFYPSVLLHIQISKASSLFLSACVNVVIKWMWLNWVCIVCIIDSCVVALVQEVTSFLSSLTTCLACYSHSKCDWLTYTVGQCVHSFVTSHRACGMHYFVTRFFGIFLAPFLQIWTDWWSWIWTDYLSHCYTIAWDRLSNQFFFVCVCVCVSMGTLTVAFSTDLHEIW